MHRSRLLVVALLAGTAASQSNPFIVFPQDPERQGITCASYVRRPNWNNAAEGFQELGAAMFRGIGDTNGTCSVRGIYHWAADENVATSETYGIVLRTGLPGLGPDPTNAGVIVRVSGLTTPTRAGGPRGTFLIVDGFATPIAVPCGGDWYQGIEFPANPSWPATDGHSLWAADVPGISPATTGENPRGGAPPVTWSIDPVLASTATTSWTYILGALVDQPTLRLGGTDPLSTRQGTGGGANLGMGGLYPDVSANPRRDGVLLRVHDNAQPAGLAVFAAAASFGSFAFPVPGLAGQVHLDPASVTTLGIGFLSGGQAQLVVVAPNVLGPTFLGVSLAFQAVVVAPGTSQAAFSNACAVSL